MRSSPHSTTLAALAALAAVCWPSAAPAQFEIAPSLGMYFPLGEWTQVSDGGTGYKPSRRQLPAHMLSARATTWLSKHVAVEGTFSFSPSQVAVSVDRSTTDIRGRVLMASGRALFKVASLQDGHPSEPMHWDFIVGAGGGLVHRSGNAWENTSGVTRPAFVFTAAVRAPLAGSVTWRVGLEDFVSWTHFDEGLATQTRARMHHDLIGSLAVAVRLGP